MAQKIGGGKRMENYDSKTGKYCSNNNAINEFEEYDPFFKIAMNDVLSPYWEERRNAEKLIDYLKNQNFIKAIDSAKVDYLLNYKSSNDKSRFLKEMLGYKHETLLNDIQCNTDFKRMMYSNTTKYGIRIIACTTLKSQFSNKVYLVTSVWQLEHINKLKFITLYPGGERIWDFVYSKK